MVTILHLYSNKRPKDEKDCWKELKKIRKHYKVIDRQMDASMDNDNFLKEYWGTDDLITVEGDNVPELKLLEEMLNCKEPWCVSPYYQHYTNMNGNKIKVTYYDDNGKKRVEKTQGFKVVSGLGFTKISKEIQDKVSFDIWYGKGPKDAEWMNLDARISMSIKGIMHIFPHMHKETKHHHKLDWQSDRHNIPFEGLNMLFEVGLKSEVVTVTATSPEAIVPPDSITLKKYPDTHITINWVDAEGKPLDISKPIPLGSPRKIGDKKDQKT
jgi:hypothetical protein